MLHDGLSQLLYDNVLILKLVGHCKFYFPVTNFENMLEVTSQSEFSDPTYPHHYLGLPLIKTNCILRVGRNDINLNIVHATGFAEGFNCYRQYFIKRDDFTTIPGEGQIVFDCGACIGDISTVIAGMVGQRGQVHIFDPVPLHTKFCNLQATINPVLSDAFHINTLAVGKETSHVNRGHIMDSNSIEPGGLAINCYDTTNLDDYAANKNINNIKNRLC